VIKKLTFCYFWLLLHVLKLYPCEYLSVLTAQSLLSVRPSVHPSITLVHCIQIAEDIVKLYRPGSLVILVFDTHRCYPIPRGTPSAGAQNTRGGKNRRLSETERDRPNVAGICTLSNGDISSDLDRPLTWFSRSWHF